MTRQNFTHRLLLGLAVLVLLAGTGVPTSARADYPDRPIRMIIPYPPGGSLDPIGRLLAEALAKHLEQAVVVENVAGAGGMIGAARVAKSAPDGYTVLAGITSNIALAPLVTPNAAYQADDFDAIGMVGTSGMVLVSKPDLPVHDLEQWLRAAHARPGAYSYGIPGSGSLFHLVMEAIKADTGINVVAVPYRGAGQASVDIMGGQLEVALLGLPAMLPHIAAGKMKALAVMSKEPDIGNPDIPSAADIPALAGMDYTIWTGLFAPKGVPPEVRQRLHDALNSVLVSADVVQAYAQMGVKAASPQPAGAFAEFVEKDIARIRHDIARTHFKIE